LIGGITDTHLPLQITGFQVLWNKANKQSREKHQ